MTNDVSFALDPDGFLRHWLVAGVVRTPYTGPRGTDDAMRQAAADPQVGPPPAGVRLGAVGPGGLPWRYRWPGWNVFVEESGFYHKLEVLNLHAETLLHAQAGGSRRVRVWAVGVLDLWLNGTHVVRHAVPKYMYPESTVVTLDLRPGGNTLAARLQTLGVRDTRVLFGLQFVDGTDGLSVALPGADMRALKQASTWMESIRVTGDGRLAAAAPPPCPVRISSAAASRDWSADAAAVPALPQAEMRVTAHVGEQTLVRELERPGAIVLPEPAGGTLDEHRRACLERIARNGGEGHLATQALLARRLLGFAPTATEAAELTAALRFVDDRNDCADFTLALLLRAVALRKLSPQETAAVADTAQRFRYWDDEAGTDAMCFGSENHSLLFHGCQMLAGSLWPDARFEALGRTGAEQARRGAARCRAWADTLLREGGFCEFLSSGYMPITIAALLNVADFADDAALAADAAQLVDRILRELALHSFDGVAVGPQGRAYRNQVLKPWTSSAQALLYYANPAAVPAYSGWIVFPASSPGYRMPEDLATIMAAPATRQYRHGLVNLHVTKTRGYLLSAVALDWRVHPASSTWDHDLRAGNPGYQQHVWHATLGSRCHVFVNHPGAHDDLTMARPGYWYGNGILPCVRPEADRLAEVFEIPETHPVRFTHAHWPADLFSRQLRSAHWLFGEYGQGRVALWCSAALEPHDEVLTGREYRASGRCSAWLCVCGETNQESFEAFIARCRALAPRQEGREVQLADAAPCAS